MNVDTLTIGNMFSQPVAPPPLASPKSDTAAETTPFSPAREHSEQPADRTQAAKPTKARTETPTETAPEERKHFRQVIDKRTKPGESQQNNKLSKIGSHNTEPKASDQAESAQNVAVPNPDSSDQNRKESASKNTPHTRQRLAGLTDTNKAKKTQQGLENSLEDKADGSRTVRTTKTERLATGKFENIPVDASIGKTGNSESPKISNKTATKPTDTKNQVNAREPSSVTKAVDNPRTANLAKETPVVEKSSEPVSAATPTKHTEDFTDQKPDPGTESMKAVAKPTDTKNQANAKEPSSATQAVDNPKSVDRAMAPSAAEKSSEPVSAQTPTKPAEDFTDQKPDPGTESTADMGRAKTSPPVIPAATSKTEAAHVIKQTGTETSSDNTDKAASTAKVIPKDAVETIPKDTVKVTPKDQEKPQLISDPTARQTPAKQVRTFGDKIVNDGNNTENAASKTTESQTYMGRARSGNSHNSGDSSKQNSTQIFSQNTVQSSATEQTSTFSVATKAPILSEQPQPAPGNGPANVASQVLEAVRNSVSQQPTGDKEITIQLNPPELGKVSVKFRERGAEITGTLEVSNAQTRAEIEQALPEMLRSLADSGIAIKRLEVVLSQNDQPDQQSAKDALPQNDQYQQQGSANPNPSGEQKQTKQNSYGPTARGRYQYLNPTHTDQMLITNTSINMLV